MVSSEAGPSTFYEWSSGMELVENHGEQAHVCDEILENEFHNENELVEKCLPNREELVNHVKKLAIAQGFAVTIKRSYSRYKFVILGCDRGGTYRNSHNIQDDERKKNASSRLVNCPFEVRGKQNVDGSWKLTIKSLEHNHERANVLVGHPSLRRFSEEEKKKIKQMKSSNIPPRQILTALRKENPNLEVTSRDLYNMTQKLRKEQLGGRTPIEALLEDLGKCGFDYKLNYDDEGHLSHLFFVHPLSIKLTKSYDNVFLMDCTYKTNKYHMPLLNIIGVTSFNSNFFSCFAFIRNEKFEDYLWALQMFRNVLGIDPKRRVIVTDRNLALKSAIDLVFSDSVHILCIWHINKNILARCKRLFKKQEEWDAFISEWNSLVESSSEEAFYRAFEMFKENFRDHVDALNYLVNTWIPYKEQFVKAWINKCLHFQNRATSRVEGAHAMLKRYIYTSVSDLDIVQSKICNAIENQFQEIRAQLEMERIRTPHISNIPFFAEVNGNVSHFALNELYKQYDLLKNKSLSCICTNEFTTTMGLPCAHQMMSMEKIYLDKIHSQWRIGKRSFNDLDIQIIQDVAQLDILFDGIKKNYGKWDSSKQSAFQNDIHKYANNTMPLNHEPIIQHSKGRRPGSKASKSKNSTRRDPSAFEIAENVRRCRICKNVGHNSRTCPNKITAHTLESVHSRKWNRNSIFNGK